MLLEDFPFDETPLLRGPWMKLHRSQSGGWQPERSIGDCTEDLCALAGVKCPLVLVGS